MVMHAAAVRRAAAALLLLLVGSRTDQAATQSVGEGAPPPPELSRRLLVIRMQTEDSFLYAQQSEANLQAWCDGCSKFGWRCEYRLFRSVPVARVGHHPGFARFFAARQAMLHHHRGYESAPDRNLTWISDGEDDDVAPYAGQPSLDNSRYSVVLFVDPDVAFVGVSSPEAIFDALWASYDRGNQVAPLAFFGDEQGNVDAGCFMMRPDIISADGQAARSYRRACDVLNALDQYQPDPLAPVAEAYQTSGGHQSAGFKEHLAASPNGPTATTLPFAQGQVALFHLEYANARAQIHIEASSPSSSAVFLRDLNLTACSNSFRASQESLMVRYSGVCSVIELAQHFKTLNREKSMPAPPIGAENPFIPVLGLVAYGEEHNRKETSHFLRSLFVHRSLPLKIIIIGDTIGLQTLFDVMANHALVDLLDERDEIRLINMDVLFRWLEIERLIHAHTKQRHPRLFIKLFTHELFPHLSKIMMLDNDLLVLDDIKNLWAEFDHFKIENIVSMTIDQSNRWYYRFQDPSDEIYSPGWVGLANRCGVNGGIQLWHNDNLRRTQPNWSYMAVKLTHTGAHRSASDLQYFGILQEQDLLNVAIIDNPQMWKPLDCVWNYLPKTVGPHGGHITETVDGTLSTFIDRCHAHVAHSAEQPELFGCSCGRKVRILHFVGMTKESNPQAHLLFQFWGHAPLDQLRMVAQQNLDARDDPGAGTGAVRLFVETAADAHQHSRPEDFVSESVAI